MSFCQGDHQLSWRGSSNGYAVNASGWEGYEYGDTVVVRCGTVFADPGCPLNREGATMTAPVYNEHVVMALATAGPMGMGAGGNSSVSVSLSTGVTTTSEGMAEGTAR